jgi:hypothetical protein
MPLPALSRFAFPVALALVALPAGAEDLTIVSKSVHDQNPPQITTSYIASDRMRMVTPEGSEILAEPAAGKFTMIDNKKKEYYVVTKQDMEAMYQEMAARMKEAEPKMREAQEKMKSLPPEMQQKMAALMGGGFAAQINVAKGPGSRTIAGYKCDNWTVSIGTLSKTEECLTQDVPFPPQIWESYQDFANSMKTAMSAMGPMGQSMAQLQEKMKDLKGLPLASSTTLSVMGKTTVNSQEVTDIKKGPVPASAWVIPADYKLVESPMARLGKKK